MKLQHKYFFVFSSFFLALLLSFCVFCLLVLFFCFFWIFARSWGILPIPGGYCPCLGDTARAWWNLPVPRGFYPFLGDTARAWGILPVPGGTCPCLGDFTSPYEGFYLIQRAGINGSC
jgi:hypothetical protein